MTVGVGDDVAYAATPEPRTESGWHDRFIVAFGGAVVVAIGMMPASAWTTGLRPYTFDQLRSDLDDGTVQQWYAAEHIDQAPLDLRRAPSSTVRGDLEQPVEGEFLPPKGDPLGGILVWRTWGTPGWQVASQSGVEAAGDSYYEAATEASAALVRELRAADVPMKPFEFSEGTALDWVQGVGAFLLIAGLIMGAAPRVGTRWFWFWVLITVPLALGAVAYAVMELIGLRRRPDPPLKRRLTGLMGSVGSIVASFVVGLVAHWLRGRGVSLPF